jgi:hypothetical protein
MGLFRAEQAKSQGSEADLRITHGSQNSRVEACSRIDSDSPGRDLPNRDLR